MWQHMQTHILSSGFPSAYVALCMRSKGWLSILSMFLWAACAEAQLEPRVQGEWINISGEITSEVYNQTKIDIERAIKNQARVIVFHFQSAEYSSFGPCLDLANYLLDKIEARVDTVAFVDRPVHGNVVLPILACNKVYLTTARAELPEASLGFNQASLDRMQPIDRTKMNAYLQIAERRGRPAALLLKMLDPNLAVFEFEANGKRYKLDPNRAERYQLPNTVLLNPEERRLQPQLILEPGRLGIYSAKEAEASGLINRTVATAQELVERLRIPPSVLKGNLLHITQPRAAVIHISGEIDGGTVDTVLRKVKKAIEADKVNCLILQLDNVHGGPKSVERSEKLGREIRDRAKKSNVLTVAYIPESATGSAHYITLACDQIVLGPSATLGDCKSLVFEDVSGKRPLNENDVQLYRNQLIQLAEPQLYSPMLIRGFFDIHLELVLAQERSTPDRPMDAGNSGYVFLQRSEVRGNWERVPNVPDVKKAGELLVMTGETAVRWGMVRATLQSKDIDGVIGIYGIRKADVVFMRTDWLDTLVMILRNEFTTLLLVVIGFTCVILELKAPGTTIPGVIAALCFLLVFWSQSWLAGELNALAILLFLLGLVLIGVEVFILPGFGVTGVSGIALMLLGLSLLVVKQWPQSEAEYLVLAQKFGVFAAALVVALLGGFSLAKYLPKIPVANRLMLKPFDETAGDSAIGFPMTISSELLGAFGTAVTELRPAGKAVFGDQYIDVLADGSYIDAGTRIQIIEIEGLRVVVRAV